MSRSFSEVFIDAAIRRQRERAEYALSYLREYHPTDSPIEALMLASLWIVGNDAGGLIFDEPPLGMKDAVFFVKLQEPILTYRADFVVGLVAYPTAQRMVVECDGHAFHERTKQQAARDRQRDRDMQSAGLKVFRFTGSEIYRDPLKCADEVIQELASLNGKLSEGALNV